jgi:hypothetical protein
MSDCPSTDILDHVHSCEDCRAQLATMMATSEAFTTETVPEHILARIDSAIAQAARTETVKQRARSRVARAAEAVLAGATGIMIALTTGTPLNTTTLVGAFLVFSVIPFLNFGTMKRVVLLAVFLSAPQLHAQSLYLNSGQRAIQVTAGLSTGPDSHGEDVTLSAGLGSVDVGFTLAHYTYTPDDALKSSYKEYAPFVRAFLLKQQANGAPVSISVNAQVFVADYGNDDDSGNYVQVGTTVYKALRLNDRFAMQPYAGFAFVAESYTFGGGAADKAQYLSRDLGIHFTTAPEKPWLFRITLAEQAFRRETYRAARIGLMRRL